MFLKSLLFYVLMLSAFALMIFTIGCAFVPVFHNTSETQLETLSNSLTDTRLDDLFRHYPTLRLVKSTDIGNGNLRHEFSYVITETEDGSKRSAFKGSPDYLLESKTTFSINIFVNDKGVIYEVLQPVPTDTQIVVSVETYDRFQKTKNKVVSKKPR